VLGSGSPRAWRWFLLRVWPGSAGFAVLDLDEHHGWRMPLADLGRGGGVPIFGSLLLGGKRSLTKLNAFERMATSFTK
jgi:hypothetical protein